MIYLYFYHLHSEVRAYKVCLKQHHQEAICSVKNNYTQLALFDNDEMVALDFPSGV